MRLAFVWASLLFPDVVPHCHLLRGMPQRYCRFPVPGHCLIAVCKISQKSVSHEFAGFPVGVRMCVCMCVSHSVMSDCLLPHVAYQAPLCMGILQARILEWVAIPFSRGSSQTRNWTQVSITARSTWKTALQAVFIVWASNFIQAFPVHIKVMFILYCNISVQ